MKCPKCQKDIPDNSGFCQFCGASTTSVQTGPTTSADAAGARAAGGPQFPLPSPTAAAAATDPASEQPVWQGRPSWKYYFWHWIIWLVASIVAVYVGSQGGWLPWALLGSAILLAIVLLIELIQVYSIRYRLTTQRLFFDRGILSRTTDQTELVRVDDVRVHRTLFDRIFGTGTIILTSTDQTDRTPTLRGINDPLPVSEEIRRHTRQVRGKQTLFVESV